MEEVAIIGTGIAGMACARKLHPAVKLTLFEAEAQPGGHTCTVDAPGPEGPVPVDTGFMVYNETTYPLLTQLFEDLHVETVPTEMSFGVQYRPHGLEFCGSSLNQLFAQRGNLLNGRFLGMLAEVVRFNRLAVASLGDPGLAGTSLREFVATHRFSPAFLEYYLVPMTSAIWSTPPDEMLLFPARTLIRFMYNHGLLGVRTHHQWRTVKGGSRQYRDRLIAPFRDRIRSGCPVVSLRRSEQGILLRDASGQQHRFDRAVLATHADTALRLLENPTKKEQHLLSCFPYAKNRITLHSDATVMPGTTRAWASWNYRIDALPDGRRQASTHYWMNRLQHLPGPQNYFVSLNEPDIVRRDLVHREFIFDHPVFSADTEVAQIGLPRLNAEGPLYFCGSYFRYGFHEDGLMAGQAAAENLLAHTATRHEQLAV